MTVRFTDASLNNPTSWMWDFNNDGRIDSKLQNPIHSYPEPGSYTVTLTVANSAGSDNVTKFRYITVEKTIIPPVAAFSATPIAGYAPLIVQFTDMSLNNPVSWQWDFNNDGKSDDKQRNPGHTYLEPGIYSVRLTIWNRGGSDEALENGYITVLVPVTSAEATLVPSTVRAASPSAVILTSAVPSVTTSSSTTPGSTSAPSGAADTGKPPDYSFLLLVLIGAVVLGSSYLWQRSRKSRASTDDMQGLHVEMSGGIEFSGEPAQDYEDNLSEKIPHEDEK